jgi:hypothetical protein
LDARVHFKHVQVIRSDIEPELVNKCTDVENEPISRGKLREIPLGPIFKTPPYSLETEDGIFKA